MKFPSFSLLALSLAAVLLWPQPGRWQLAERTARQLGSEVSRLLASTNDTAGDVLVVLDWTVSDWHRRQLKDFTADLVFNIAGNPNDWRLNVGVVLFHDNVSYELPLSDDYAALLDQLSDPSFAADLNASGVSGPLPRRTALALQTCSDLVLQRGAVSTVLLVLTAGVSEDVSRTIQRAAKLKVEQQVVIFAIAMDPAESRDPSRNLELAGLSTDSQREFNVILPPPPTTTTTWTSSTDTSSTGTRTSSTETTSTSSSQTVTTSTLTTSTATTATQTTSTRTSSTRTTVTETTSTVSKTTSTSSTATVTTSTSSSVTATTTSSTSSTATKTTSTSSSMTSTSSTATKTTSTSSSATITTSTSSSVTKTSTSATVTSSTSSTATVTTSTDTTSTETTSTFTSATTSTTTSSTITFANGTNETNGTTTTTTSTTLFHSVTTSTSTTMLITTTDDDRRLFGTGNPIDLADLASLLGFDLLDFFTEIFESLSTSTFEPPEEPYEGAGPLEAGIVVVIVLLTCCVICVLMGIAYYAYQSLVVAEKVAPLTTTSVVPVPAVPRPAPPQPRDATQKALKEAIDMQDVTRLRTLLSEILLKGWPEKKYTDLVLKALEVVATLKESAAMVLEEALYDGHLPPGSLADARVAGVDRELLERAEGLRLRPGTAQSLA